MGTNIITQLIKLNKLLTLVRRKTLFVDITSDEKYTATKGAIALKADVQGRTVKVGFQIGGLEIAYFIFGQDQDKPEAEGVIEVTPDFVDASIEVLLPQVKEALAADLVNKLVEQKLKDLGL